MIEFKIISCPDRSQQATYRHVSSELTLGRTTGDMIVDDPGFGDTQLRVRLEGPRATLENLHPQVEVRLNGKGISGVVPLKEKDNITVARTTINFSRLDLSPIPLPEAYEYPHKEKVGPGTKERTLMDALQYLEGQAPGAAVGARPPTPGGMPPRPPLPPGAGMPKAPPPLPPGLPPLPKK